jgi:hypothetical protein
MTTTPEELAAVKQEIKSAGMVSLAYAVIDLRKVETKTADEELLIRLLEAEIDRRAQRKFRHPRFRMRCA